MRLLLAAAVLTAAACHGRDLEDCCWFAAGFDGPARVNGGAFPGETEPACRREGRYGAGCHFHGEAENRLPPMAEFLGSSSNFYTRGAVTLETGKTLRSSGGTFGVRPREVPVRSRTPWNYKTTAYTCSFHVKGAAGGTLTARVVAEPLTEAERAKIARSCSGNFEKPSEVPIRPDVASNAVCRLTGGWQRVYAYVRFDHRAKFTGRRIGLEIDSPAAEFRDFQFHQSDEHPRWGRFAPSPFVDGGRRLRPLALSTSDSFFLDGFPSSRGSCVAWVRIPDEERQVKRAGTPIWGFSCEGGARWQCAAESFQLPKSPRVFMKDLPPLRADGWRHVAWTWSNGVVRAYADGSPCAVTGRGDAKAIPEKIVRPVFACGGFAPGDAASEAILDDVAIFTDVLDASKIASIAASRTALFAASHRVWMQPFDLTVYFRNQTNAALRTSLWSPRVVSCRVKASVGGFPLPELRLEVPKGGSRLTVPFDPALYAPSRYPFEVRLEDEDGKAVAASRGTLEIKGRLERDAFRIFSWGGWKPIREEFLDLLGVNAVNCETRIDVRRHAMRGVFTNIRYENSRKQDVWGYDWKAMAEKAGEDLSYAQGLHTWVSTLVNSEVYGAGKAAEPSRIGWYAEMARREIGCEPEWSFLDGTDEVHYGKLKEKPPRGIVDGRHRTLKTLYWFMDVGMPTYRLNAELTKVVHGLSPDNTVWTEPLSSVGGIGKHVDMMADWIYEYDANVTLSQLREQYGYQRALGKPYQPTVSTYYYPKLRGRNPVTGKGGVELCQSADEVMVKSWMALAAVRADVLGVFAADYWQHGVTNAQVLAQNPAADVWTVADPDAPERFGTFVRSRYLPAAELLRGMENARAPVALLLTAEGQLAGGFWWGHYWYRRELCRLLCRAGIPFDVIHEHEISSEVLSQYRYIVFPMSTLVTREHDKILREVAEKGVRIVLDDYATYSYPHTIKPGFRYEKDITTNPRRLKDPFNGWYTNVVDELRGELLAWSDADSVGAQDSYTFVKAEDGVRYVTVVNNRRRAGGSVLTKFLTNDWYRPVSVPLSIATHLKVPAGGCVYEYNSKAKSIDANGRDEVVVRRDYAAAEGRVYVVYPRPLEKVRLSVGGDLRAGGCGWVDVTVVDAGGKPAPGRQVVRLMLRAPDGTERDESGLYAVRGTRRIPLRFARGEVSSSFFSRWRVEAVELTSGLRKDVSFRLAD